MDTEGLQGEMTPIPCFEPRQLQMAYIRLVEQTCYSEKEMRNLRDRVEDGDPLCNKWIVVKNETKRRDFLGLSARPLPILW